MLNQPDTKRNVIILVAVLLIGVAAYFFFFQKNSPAADVASPEDVQADAEVEEVLGVLQELQSINLSAQDIANLNASVFFRNFHKDIVPGNRGKINPFNE